MYRLIQIQQIGDYENLYGKREIETELYLV